MNADFRLKRKAGELLKKIDREIFNTRLFLEKDGVELSKFVSKIDTQEHFSQNPQSILEDLVEQSKDDLEMSGWVHYCSSFEGKPAYFVPFVVASELRSYLVFKYGSRTDVELKDAIYHVFRQEEVTDVSPPLFFEYVMKSRKKDDALREFISGNPCPRIEKDYLDLVRCCLISFYEDFNFQEERVGDEKIRKKISRLRVSPQGKAPLPKNENHLPIPQTIEDPETDMEELYVENYILVKEASPDTFLPVEQALEIYLGPSLDFNYGKRMNLLRHLLSCNREFRCLAQFDPQDVLKVEKWTIARKNIPNLFKKIDDWQLVDGQELLKPSEDALYLIKN